MHRYRPNEARGNLLIGLRQELWDARGTLQWPPDPRVLTARGSVPCIML